MDGRRGKTFTVKSYAQKSLRSPSLPLSPVLIKAIRPGYPPVGERPKLIRYYLFLIIFDSISPEIPTRISSPSTLPPPNLYPPTHLPALGRNRIIKPLIGALLPNPRSEFLLALSSLPLSI